MISIAGTVRGDARMLRTRDGRALLQLEVDVPNLPRPAEVLRARPVTLLVLSDMGTGESAAYAAKARAQRLRRGVRVVVHGLGLQQVRGGAVALQGLQRIDEPDLRIRNVTGDDRD